MINKNKTSELGGNKYNYNCIIAENFKNENIFVCFNENKIPFNPKIKGLINAKSNNPETWGTYAEALNKIKNNPTLKGIGIELGNTSKGNLCGLDFDYCIDEQGNISKEVKEIIKLMDSYTEISLSKKGIHILFFANKKGSNCKVSGLTWCKSLEMYDKNRYFTLSGLCINNKGIENRQTQADIIYNKYFLKKKNSINENQKISTKYFSDKQKRDYEQYFFNYVLKIDIGLFNYWYGNRPYNNESSNDLGFLNKLAYWLHDYNLIQEYFLKSPYFEQKNQVHKDKCLIRKDYLKRSILEALGG